MRSLKEMINISESIEKKQYDISKLSNIDDLVSSIVSRVNKWDKNKLKNSHDPMILLYINKNFVWKQYKYIEDDEDYGYLQDYAVGKDARDCIIGIFFDRCFFPIINEITFNNFKKYLK